MFVQVVVHIIGAIVVVVQMYTIAQFVPFKAKWWQVLFFLSFLLVRELFIFDIPFRARIEGIYIFVEIMPLVASIAFVLCSYGGPVWKKLTLLSLVHGIAMACDRIVHQLFVTITQVPVEAFYIDPFSIVTMHAAIALGLFIVVTYGVLIWVSKAISLRRFSLSFYYFPFFPLG